MSRDRFRCLLPPTISSPVPAIAENGVSADAVVFGEAAPFDGPAAALGTGMRAGLQALAWIAHGGERPQKDAVGRCWGRWPSWERMR